jgi:hypothetical protein
LKEEYEYWKDLLYEYSDGNPDHWTPEETAYSLEIQRVEQEMKDLGLWSYNDPTTPEDDEPITSYAVPYITVNDIWAQAGTINVMGQDLLGSGSLNAPGNVSVAITNNSPAYLRINEITIPDHVGGGPLQRQMLKAMRISPGSMSKDLALADVNESIKINPETPAVSRQAMP